MQTEAIFENIANRIIEEIKAANKSIYIAVAWFTNKSIFEELLKKAKQGCSIQIIISNDEINENSSIDFELLEKSNGNVYKIGNGGSELMHNKFCVIDYNTVITGSYNWSYKAESNFENIDAVLSSLGVKAVDAILFDLGVSSLQLDSALRGFSFRHDGPLDMRMDASGKVSALEIVNTYSEEDIAEILWKYGEERFASRIARNIVKARAASHSTR